MQETRAGGRFFMSHLRTVMFFVGVYFLMIPIINGMNSSNDLVVSWHKALEAKAEAENAFKQAQKSEDLTRKKQDLVIEKANRLSKEIEEKRNSGQKDISSLIKQRDSALSMAEKWGSELTGKENIRKQAENELKKVDIEIQKLEKQAKDLGVLLQASDTVSLNVNDYIKQVSNNLNSEPDAVRREIILKDALINAVNKYDAYIEQREALSALIALSDKTNDPLVNYMQERVAQIDSFLPGRVKKTAHNELDRSLALYNKIKQDQEDSLIKRYNDVWYPEISTRSAGSEEFADKKDTLTKELQQAEALIKAYGLFGKRSEVPALFQGALDVLNSDFKKEVAPTVKENIPLFTQIISTAGSLAGNLMPGDVIGGVKVTADAVASYVALKASDVVEGLKYVVEESPGYLRDKLQVVGGKLIENAESLQAVAQQLNALPESLESTAQTFQEIDRQLALVQSAAKYVPGESSLGLIESIQGPRELIKTFQDYKEQAKSIGLVGFVIEKVAQFEKVIGDNILKVSGDKLVVIEGIDKARLRIEEERLSLNPERRNKFTGIFDAVKSAIKNIGRYVKDFIDKASGSLRSAESNYELARKNYLVLLDFTQEEIEANPSSAEISKRLAVILRDPSKKENLEYATTMLASAAGQIADVYKKLSNELTGAMTGVEFLIKAWDTALIRNKTDDIVGLVNNIFDLRDQKLAYLSAAKEGLSEVEQIIRDIDDQELRSVGADWTKKVSVVVSGQLISTIADYGQAVKNIDAQLKERRRLVEESMGKI